MVKIKTFRAKSLQSALAQVRDELGPDAAVLSTRDVPSRLLGLLGGKHIEVTASTTIQVPSRLPGIINDDPIANTSPALRSKDSNPILHRSSLESIPRRQTEELENLTGHSFKEDDPSRLERTSETNPKHIDLFNEMLHCGLEPTWARHLLHLAEQGLTPEQWSDPWMVRGKLAHWVQSQLSIAPPIEIPKRSRPYVVALIGPTGVGKTTTLAKLAAGFTLEEKVRVGLITIDTFRIGAVDQLRKYAEIMNLPMAVVESEGEMRSAMEQMSDCQILMIDSAGRTPRDASMLDQLRELLQASRVDETHLVLSATTSAGCFQDALHRYAVVQPNRLIISKLDEVRGLGELFPQLRQSPLAISYVTTGQNVPKDIEPAQKTRLAAFMLGQCSLQRS